MQTAWRRAWRFSPGSHPEIGSHVEKGTGGRSQGWQAASRKRRGGAGATCCGRLARIAGEAALHVGAAGGAAAYPNTLSAIVMATMLAPCIYKAR